MSLESSTLTVTPFNMLPIEIENPDATPEEIKTQQETIRDTIVNRRNDELEHDSVAMELVGDSCSRSTFEADSTQTGVQVGVRYNDQCLCV